MTIAPSDEKQLRLAAADEGQTLAATARKHGLAATWSEARRLVTGGKLAVDGQVILDPAHRVREGALVSYKPRSPKPVPPVPGRIVFDDSQVVVIDKPEGYSSVPYVGKGGHEDDEPEVDEGTTAMDLVRGHWRKRGRKAAETPLHVVHRIDKDTSGLLVFAKTKSAEKALAALFRAHDVERTYLCVVHGSLTDRRIESRLVEDRGDGLRGSTRQPHQGKRAVTHVRVLETIGTQATQCEVRLETGKTHQIRIHLAENGHPLVGETVYMRDWVRHERALLPAKRLLLHAATLAFVHPTTGERVAFEAPLPRDFVDGVTALRKL